MFTGSLYQQHTIINKMVYLPIVARLACGSSPVDPRGRWEESGSGLVSVYKADWERFHGMVVFICYFSLVCFDALFMTEATSTRMRFHVPSTRKR